VVKELASGEADHLPVPIAQLADANPSGEGWNHGFGPLLRVDEEPFFIELYRRQRFVAVVVSRDVLAA
jgi:hypothetical protein